MSPAIEISFQFPTPEQAQRARRAIRYLISELATGYATDAGFCIDLDYGTAKSTDHTIRLVPSAENITQCVLVTRDTPQAVPLSERPGELFPRIARTDVAPDERTSLLDDAGRLSDDGAPVAENPEISGNS